MNSIYCKSALIGLALSMSAGNAWSSGGEIPEADWKPITSEKLIKLPAGYLDRYVEQDFRQSTLARQINSAGTAMQGDLEHIRSLREQVKDSSGEQKTELRHQLLVAKSNYLDALEQKQKLDRSALEKKAKVYQSVLRDMLKDKQRRQDPVTVELLAHQRAARERMQRSITVVDEILAGQPELKRSKYSQQYGENLARVEELKSAIANHMANAAPMIEGQDVSREEFVRYLLANVESERALLDQEQLMMGYMARLVALDAHALEQEVALGINGEIDGPGNGTATKRLADATELFIE